MARIQLASNNDDIRGKIGNIVYSKNRVGNFQRKRVQGTQSRSFYQDIARQALTFVSQIWKVLPQDKITAWNIAAKNVKFTNVFGGKYNPSGFNYFCKLNWIRIIANQPLASVPPNIVPMQEIHGQVNVDLGISQIMTWFADPIPAGIFIFGSSMPLLSRGRTALKPRQANIFTVSDSTIAQPYNAWDEWIYKFGTPSLENKNMYYVYHFYWISGDGDNYWEFADQEISLLMLSPGSAFYYYNF